MLGSDYWASLFPIQVSDLTDDLLKAIDLVLVMSVEPGFGGQSFMSSAFDKIKELTKATIRCIALDRKEEVGKCVLTGAPSKGRVLFAKAY
jgi:pentose-5-phosphate-3-epimerase